MIFVTVGTHDHPFLRMLDWIEPLSRAHELVVQHGHTPARSGLRARWVDFVGYDETRDLMASSTAVVAHAGVGTILTALSVGKTPIVVPRLRRHGEHVDDHQVQIARELERSGHIIVARASGEIAAALPRAKLEARELGLRNGALRRAIVHAVG